MLSYGAYKLVHFFGLFLAIAAIGGIAAHAETGAPKSARRWLGALHGIGLVISLLGGFGMLAKLGLAGSLPMWVWLKLGLWLLLGAAPALAARSATLARALLVALPIVATLAAWIALNRPGS